MRLIRRNLCYITAAAVAALYVLLFVRPHVQRALNAPSLPALPEQVEVVHVPAWPIREYDTSPPGMPPPEPQRASLIALPEQPAEAAPQPKAKRVSRTIDARPFAPRAPEARVLYDQPQPPEPDLYTIDWFKLRLSKFGGEVGQAISITFGVRL